MLSVANSNIIRFSFILPLSIPDKINKNPIFFGSLQVRATRNEYEVNISVCFWGVLQHRQNR